LLFGVLLGFGLAMVFNSVVSAYGGGSQVPVVAAQAQQSSQQPAAQQQQEVQPAKEEEKPEQQQPPEHKAQDEKPLCTFLSGAAPEPVPTPARSNLFKVLQQEGLKIGAELGVQVRVQLLLPGRFPCLPPGLGRPPWHLLYRSGTAAAPE
jgi:hypothetical protein